MQDTAVNTVFCKEEHFYWPHQILAAPNRSRDQSQAWWLIGIREFGLLLLKVQCLGGNEIGSLDGNRFVPLFNPRKGLWQDHFIMGGFVIEPLTAEGRVTARLLRLNIDQRLAERRAIEGA